MNKELGEDAKVELGNEEISNLLNFDPFAPPDGAAPDAGSADGAATEQPKPEGKATAADKETSAPVPDASGAAPKEKPLVADPATQTQPADYGKQLAEAMAQLAKVQEQNAAMMAELAKVRNAPQEAAGAAPEAPAYAVEIPDQLANAIFSEDPAQARQGLNYMVNSIMNKLHADFSAALQQQSAAIVQQVSRDVPQRIYQEQSAAQQAKTIHDDFYGTYPEFNKPELKPLVQTVTLEKAKARLAAGLSTDWSKEFRDDIAQTLRLIFAAGAPPAPAPAPRPAPQSRPTARPASTTGLSQEQEDIMGVISSFL